VLLHNYATANRGKESHRIGIQRQRIKIALSRVFLHSFPHLLGLFYFVRYSMDEVIDDRVWVPLEIQHNFETKQHFINVCCKVVRDKFGNDYLTRRFFHIMHLLYDGTEEFMSGEWVVDYDFEYKSPLRVFVSSLVQCKDVSSLTAAMNKGKADGINLKDGVFPAQCISKRREYGAQDYEYESPFPLNGIHVKEILSAFLKPNEFGIYMLYNSEKSLIYVGKSKSLISRIPGSCIERGAYYVRFAVTTSMADMHILEPYLISTLKPPLNTDHQCLDWPTFEIPVPIFTDFIKIADETDR